MVLSTAELRRPGTFHGFGHFEPAFAPGDFKRCRWDAAPPGTAASAPEDDAAFFYGLPDAFRWEGTCRFRVATYGRAEARDHNGLTRKTLACDPAVEKSVVAGLPAAAETCRGRLHQLECPLAIACGAEAGKDPSEARDRHLDACASAGSPFDGPLRGVGETRGPLGLCPCGAARDVPMVDPDWSARFVDAVLGHLLCWSYDAFKKTWRYADWTEVSTSDGEVFSCENGCGFRGGFDLVAAHERVACAKDAGGE